MPTLYRQALLNERLNSRILFGGGRNGYSLNSIDRATSAPSVPLFSTALSTTLLHLSERRDTSYPGHP